MSADPYDRFIELLRREVYDGDTEAEMMEFLHEHGGALADLLSTEKPQRLTSVDQPMETWPDEYWESQA